MRYILTLLLLTLSCHAQIGLRDPGFLGSVYRPATVSNTITNNLLAYFRFDESSGVAKSVLDSGVWFTNSNSSNINYTTAKITNGVQLISSNGYYMISTYAPLRTNETLCVSFWVYPTALTNADGFCGVNGDRFRVIYINSSTIRIRWATVSFNYTYSMSVSNWYFIVCGKDSANNVTFISINGAAKTTSANSSSFTGSSQFLIGCDPNLTTASADGIYDEFGFWNRVLTDDEISTLYNSGSGKTYPFQ